VAPRRNTHRHTHAKKQPHLKLAVLDDVQLVGGEADLALLDEDLARLDGALAHVLDDLGLRLLAEAAEEQQVAERGLFFVW
jgi:hypothetical protein